jgi:D-alanine-D-alanine ligase
LKTVYLVHDFFDPTGRSSSAPGFYYEEVRYLSKSIAVLGYDVVCINGITEFCDKIAQIKRYDIVFNILSGSGSRNREALVPAMCEAHGLTYTGPDAFGAAFPMHKYQSKLFIQSLGVNVPSAFYFDPAIHDEDYFRGELPKLTPPYIVKPNHENMSRGVKMFKDSTGMYQYASEICLLFNQACVVEQYIAGKELAVTLLGTGDLAKVYSVMQYKEANMDEVEIFGGKQKEDNTVVYMAPGISVELTEYIKAKSLIIHKGLGLRDFSRADWRVNEHGAYFLEITPLPCLMPGTEFHFSSENSGIPFSDFLQSIL